MPMLIRMLFACTFVFSGVAMAKPLVDFSAEKNSPCWKMIEQKTTGHCKLHFTRTSEAPLPMAKRDEISRAYSRYFSARTEFPTSFQQQEFALQFFNYSVSNYAVRDSLNFIRTNDGSAQLSMNILVAGSGGYSFILADTDAHFRQLIDALQRPKARPATHYYRNIAKLFAE